MTKKQLIILIAIVLSLVAIAGGLVLIGRSRRSRGCTCQEEQDEEDSGSSHFLGGDPFPLKLGKSGPEVRKLQLYLIRKHHAGKSGNPSVDTDGVYDEAMRQLVERIFRRDNISREFYEKLNIDAE